jgi:uncharacterized membrane protein
MKKIGLLISLFILSSCTTPNNQNTNNQVGNGTNNTTTVSFASVQKVMDGKCIVCHSVNATDKSQGSPADGIAFDTTESIVSRASQINREVQSGKMPPRNTSYTLTEEEKTLINTWISQGASSN